MRYLPISPALGGRLLDAYQNTILSNFKAIIPAQLNSGYDTLVFDEWATIEALLWLEF